MTSYVTRKTPGDTSWFTHDRFGMFIHFGLYAMPARHEWVKTNEKISEEMCIRDSRYGKILTFLLLFTMLFNGGLVPSYMVNTQLPVSYTHLDVYKRQPCH